MLKSEMVNKFKLSITLLFLAGLSIFLVQSVFAQQLSFTNVVIDSQISGDVKALGDINGDGFLDIVFGGLTLVWYDYPTWTKHTIATASVEFTTDMQLGDVDNDGDLDIVVPDGDGANNVGWFENPRPAGNPTSTWTRRVIGTHGTWGHDVEVGDVDRDGRLDVVVRRDSFTNIFFQDSPTSWTRRDIGSVVGFGEGLGIGDVDRDRDLDLVVGGAWIEAPANPRIGAWIRRTISTGWPTDTTGIVADINNDGRADLVFARSHSRGRFAWFEAPMDPVSGTWTERSIDTNMGGHKINAGDLNKDGKIDLALGLELSELSIYLSDGGNPPTFTKQILSTAGAHNQRLGDIGDDGDLDIIVANYLNFQGLQLFRNNLDNALPLNSWTYKEVSNIHIQTFGLAFADLDNDFEKDIISGLYWYKNPGTNMLGNWIRGNFPAGMHAILAVNVDGDNLADVIAQRTEGANLVLYWLEAGDVSASSWNSVNIGNVPAASHALGAQGYRIAQTQRGGVEEIIISSGNGIYYFSTPANPQAGNWVRIQVNANSSDEGLAIDDIDRDGDLDIAATTGNTKFVEWYRNPGDGSPLWTAFTIGTFPEALFPDRTELADINNDGRLDIVVTEENGLTNDAQTYWWLQPVNPTSSNWQRTLITTQGTTNNMDVADINIDGKTDVILAEHRGSLKLSAWANNGLGVLTENIISTNRESHLGARTVDLDNDGDLDIVSIAYDAPQFVHLWRNNALSSVLPPNTCSSLGGVICPQYCSGTTQPSLEGSCCTSGSCTSAPPGLLYYYNLNEPNFPWMNIA